eukprot:TRINITY_DN1562_c0_g1_i2.p1 TRINITY_DN1562_c0_g1~~TRINITY_DN1562_c0_g1_i2.p1  ORF type:complete len:608 (+),score=164.14 TRINITY_DN1562_c0_g1_i2:55-1878(+)
MPCKVRLLVIVLITLFINNSLQTGAVLTYSYDCDSNTTTFQFLADYNGYFSLSHITFCGDENWTEDDNPVNTALTTKPIVCSDPIVGLDPTTAHYGIKFDCNINNLSFIGTFTIVLDGIWEMEINSGEVFKAGQTIVVGNNEGIAPCSSNRIANLCTTCCAVSPSPSTTVSIKSTRTPSVTVSDSKTPSISNSITPTISNSDTPTISNSDTPTKSNSDTPTKSETASISDTITPTKSNSDTPTKSETASISDSITPSISNSIAPSNSNSETPSISESRTPTISNSITPSLSKSSTLTPTISETPTPVPTPPSVCEINVFGEADGYSNFILKTMDSHFSDTEGRVAAGGDISLSFYSIGAVLDHGSTEYPFSLVSGGDIEFDHGSVWYGAIVGKNVDNINNVSIQIFNQTINSDACCNDELCSLCAPTATLTYPINWVRSSVCLPALQLYWFTLPTSTFVDITNEFTQLTISCNNDNQIDFTPFAIANIDFPSNISKLTINCDADITLLINSNSLNNSEEISNFEIQLLGGITYDKIVYNLYSHNLTIKNILMAGTVFAPNSNIHYANGLIKGSLIAESLSSPNNGQIDYVPFNGCLPVPQDSTQSFC